MQGVQAPLQPTGVCAHPGVQQTAARSTLAPRSRRLGWGCCLARTRPKGSPPGTWWVRRPRPHRCRASEVCLWTPPQGSRACLWTSLECGPSCWALIKVSCLGSLWGWEGVTAKRVRAVAQGFLPSDPRIEAVSVFLPRSPVAVDSREPGGWGGRPSPAQPRGVILKVPQESKEELGRDP